MTRILIEIVPYVLSESYNSNGFVLLRLNKIRLLLCWIETAKHAHAHPYTHTQLLSTCVCSALTLSIGPLFNNPDP